MLNIFNKQLNLKVDSFSYTNNQLIISQESV